MKLTILLSLIVGLLVVPSFQQKLIWIDTDPGIDEGVLDDAIAIFVGGFNANVKIVGITVVAGNASPEKVEKNALNLLNFVKLDHNIAVGAKGPLLREKYQPDPNAPKVDFIFPTHSKKSLATNAIAYIYKTLKLQSGKVTLLGIGPLTNYAILLKTYPDVKNYIEEIIFLGGAVGVGNVGPTSEFNVWCDPESTKIVINSGLKVTMMPLDVTVKTSMTDAIIERFEAMATESMFGKFLMTMINFRRNSNPDLFISLYSMFHDAVVAVYAINPKLFTTKKVNVVVDTSSDIMLNYGRTLCDINGITGRTPNVNLVLDVNVEEYWNLVMSVLTTLSTKSKNNLI